LAIADYDTLKSAVQSWAARSDSKFAAQIPTFVGMAEDRIYYGAGEPGDPDYTPALRSSVMEVTAPVTATDGVATLPNNYLEARALTVENQRVGIEYLPPERFRVYDANTSGTVPLYYTITGTTLEVSPAITGALSLSYYRRYDAISDTNPDEPVLIAHANVYLHLCLYAAFTLVRNAELAMSHLALGRSAIEGVNRQSALRRYPGPLRIRSRMVMP